MSVRTLGGVVAGALLCSACGPPLVRGREGFGTQGDEVGTETIGIADETSDVDATDETDTTESSSEDTTDTTESSSEDTTESETDTTESSSEDTTESETDTTESSSEDTTESETDTTESETDTTETGEPPCEVDVDLGEAFPVDWMGTLEAGPSGSTTGCGGEGPEMTFEWTAPADGTFRVETFGSAFDPVLGRAASCDGPELDCNEDLGVWTNEAQLTVELAAGEAIVLTVDARLADTAGDFGLSITTVDCPEGALVGPLPISVQGSTVDASNEMGSEATCGGGTAGEHAYSFTAPSDGTYVFDTLGSSFDTSLWVYAGVCGADVLDCNNDTSGELSWVAVDLQAGETVTVAIDGWVGAEGNYQLNVDRFGPEECPDATLASVTSLAFTDTTVGASNEFFDDCGGELAPDRSYSFTPPVGGLYSFSTIGSAVDTTIALRNACGGPAWVCNDDIDWFTTDSRVVVDLAAGQTQIVVVDGHDPSPGAIALQVEQIACLDEVAPASTQWQLSGTTLAGSNRLSSACGGGTASDWLVEWIAPEAGTFVVSTEGSAFDTVVHARLDGCGGAVMSCNDDALGSAKGAPLTSMIEVLVEAGDTLLIAVDGHGADAGAFELSLEPACDPLAPDCPTGQACGRRGSTFSCLPAAPLSEGDPCASVCGDGLVCVSGLEHPMCGESCCDVLCDVDAPDCGPDEICVAVFEKPDAPAWHADVGFCL